MVSLEGLQSFNPWYKHGYQPLTAARSSPRFGLYLRIGVVTVIIITLSIVLQPLSAAQTYIKQYHDGQPIPSIVHYVYIKKDADSKINFNFAHFLSLYASVMYIKPERILIHTDYSAAEIDHASKKGSKWTKKVLTTFPDLVTLNPIWVPKWAGTNEMRKIDAIEHKSDFVRWNEVLKTGGVYLDWDVVALKSLTALQNSGFAFIGGRQYGNEHEGGNINGTINNGAFLTKPNSAMAQIMVREQMSNFDGVWEGNLRFMTRTAETLLSVENQVLILDRHAFAPTHWFPESKDALFLPNEGPASPEPFQTNSSDPIERYDAMVKHRMSRQEWEMDLSATYLLHAFGQGEHNEHITPKKILARTSNYGVATWEVVRRMKEDGQIKGDEDDS